MKLKESLGTSVRAFQQILIITENAFTPCSMHTYHGLAFAKLFKVKLGR